MFHSREPQYRVGYTGPERRRGERRINAERREMIRFDLDRGERRSGKDRRHHGWDSAPSR
ncbi:hypothetical protein [Thermomonas fusca]|uniref:Uncharacterized protein n=1 Tax=Thermomonas fusca TaxID=215690 RepID=A0A5R9PH00_9GAMM|nr:hypothetical protein [Thermomonas fusca]TLX22028.1 hypothetical protein E5S66_05740 [Thermomonas fusca]